MWFIAGFMVWLLRVLYWGSASILGLFAIASSWIQVSHNVVEAACPVEDRSWITRYGWFRLGLGIFQILAHMLVLCPARLNERCAMRVTLMMGSGDARKGAASFYRFINICNVMICVVIGLSGTTLHALSGCHSTAFATKAYLKAIVGLEIASIVLLVAVLFYRLVAAVCGKTQIWFSLAWPLDEDPRSPVSPMPDTATGNPRADFFATR